MNKAIWRLILASVITTVVLTALGNPISETAAVLVTLALSLWVQESVIESIRGGRCEHDRSKGSDACGRRDAAA